MKYLILTLGLLTSLNLASAQNVELGWNPANPVFRKYYTWDDRDGTWTLHFTQAQDAYHVFTPAGTAEPRGTVFLVHGYLEHGGTQVILAREAVKAGYLVVAVDLPGHGFSPGERAAINDFRSYAQSLNRISNQRQWPQPLLAAGHSTGGATLLEAGFSGGLRPKKIWLTAPLVRSYLWGPSMFFHPVFSWAIPALPTRYGATSRVEKFNRFLASDPLTGKAVPREWVQALGRWEATTWAWKPMVWDVTVLQGDQDTVVEWQHNLEFLRSRITGLKVIMVPGAMHDPFHDASVYSEPSLRAFRNWLDLG